jgi:hypothetical protein
MIRAKSSTPYAVIRLPVLCLIVLVCANPTRVSAQAWVAPAGVGSVSVAYQTIDNTGHRAADGLIVRGFDSASKSLLINVDYAVTDRVSFSVDFPYVAAKYLGPEPSFFALPLDDCLCWNHGWQDVGVTARYNIANGAFALTPSIAAGMPSHDYEYFGEAVLGRNLNEVRIGIDAGHRLDKISPRLSVAGRYSFAFVEKVLDLSNNRSNMSVEAGYLATRKLVTRVAFSWQRSHGGLRSTEFVNEEQASQFDRILRDNSFHVSGGASYSLLRVDLFASYTHYAGGTDTHVGHAVTAGVSVPFER